MLAVVSAISAADMKEALIYLHQKSVWVQLSALKKAVVGSFVRSSGGAPAGEGVQQTVDALEPAEGGDATPPLITHLPKHGGDI